ncbi:MAG: thiamine phosphate synthase [Acidobacteriota bacterium]
MFFFNSSDNFLTYLITDGETTADNFAEKKSRILELVTIAAENNISLIQIREKKLPARLVFELVREAAEITRKSQTKILVNDRADIAFAAKAAGVHLTSHSLSAEIIRRNFPKDFVIGVSTHTIETSETAKQNGADFVTFGPIFETPDKGKPHGVEKLHEVCEKLKPFPVIALGGIDETNYKSVLENGARGFAAIRFLNNIENFKRFF